MVSLFFQGVWQGKAIYKTLNPYRGEPAHFLPFWPSAPDEDDQKLPVQQQEAYTGKNTTPCGYIMYLKTRWLEAPRQDRASPGSKLKYEHIRLTNLATQVYPLNVTTCESHVMCCMYLDTLTGEYSNYWDNLAFYVGPKQFRNSSETDEGSRNGKDKWICADVWQVLQLSQRF